MKSNLTVHPSFLGDKTFIIEDAVKDSNSSVLQLLELHCIYCIVYCKSVTHGAFTFFFHILHIDENYLSQCQKEIIIHNVAQCNSTKCW